MSKMKCEVISHHIKQMEFYSENTEKTFNGLQENSDKISFMVRAGSILLYCSPWGCTELDTTWVTEQQINSIAGSETG